MRWIGVPKTSVQTLGGAALWVIVVVLSLLAPNAPAVGHGLSPAPAGSVVSPASHSGETGQLRVRVRGVASGRVIVRGPQRYKRLLHRTKLLRGLRPGNYRIRTRRVKVSGAWVRPARSTRLRRVKSGMRARVTARYLQLNRPVQAPAPLPSQSPDPTPDPVGETVSLCDATIVPAELGRIDDSRLPEISGMTVSAADADRLWVHNDRNNPARLTAIDRSGRVQAQFSIRGAPGTDWEDLAAGSALLDDSDHLYVADIGDNGADRDFITVHRVPEPRVGVTGSTIEDVETMTLRYPGRSLDAEALLIDPQTGDLVILTRAEHTALIFSSAWAPGEATLTLRGEIAHVGPVTAADVSADGTELLLRRSPGSKHTTLYWRNAAAEPVWERLLEPADCRLPDPSASMSEAIAFARDGSGYLTVDEGLGRPITAYRR